MRFAMIVATAFALAACPRGPAKPIAPPRPATPAEVVTAGRELVEAWRKAYEAKSFDEIATLYAHDAELVVVQDGLALIGWSSVDAMLRDRFSRAARIVVRVKDVQVTAVAPSAASVVATLTREIGDGVTTVAERGAVTFVIHRDDTGAWHVVAEHYSYKKGT